MKVINWSELFGTRYRPPPLSFKEEGSVLEFHDYPEMYDMKPGDIVYYQTGRGISEFRVAEVRPAEIPNYPGRMTLVTAREMAKEKIAS